MNGPGGVEFGGHPEGAIPTTEMARAELCAALAEDIFALTTELAAEEVAADPVLDAMMARLIETGPALDPGIRAHLRKMVAWRVGDLLEVSTRAAMTADYFRMVESHIGAELREMAQFEEDLSDVPSLWDLAFQDLGALTESADVIDEFENGMDENGQGEDPYDQDPYGDSDSREDWEELPEDLPDDDY